MAELSKETKTVLGRIETLDDFRLQLSCQLGMVEEKPTKLSASGSGYALNRESSAGPRLLNEDVAESKSSAPTPAPLKLFSKLPKQITESGLEKPELMRLSAVYELIETEIDYVKDLQTMINFHKAKLAQSASEQDANLIFSNIDQLLIAHQVCYIMLTFV